MDLHRSRFLTGAAALTAGAMLPVRASATVQDDPDHAAVGTAIDALSRLRAGNARFTRFKGRKPIHPPFQRPYGRDQAPFVSLITCADSRVGPEVVFDQGLDQLFVCRIAGNIAPPEITGSIEYAVAHFHTPLVVVLGHSACGACNATITSLDSGKLPDASIASVVAAILPAARRFPTGDLGKRRAQVVRENARLTAANLRMSPIVRGNAEVVYGVHDLVSGWVTFYEAARAQG